MARSLRFRDHQGTAHGGARRRKRRTKRRNKRTKRRTHEGVEHGGARRRRNSRRTMRGGAKKAEGAALPLCTPVTHFRDPAPDAMIMSCNQIRHGWREGLCQIGTVPKEALGTNLDAKVTFGTSGKGKMLREGHHAGNKNCNPGEKSPILDKYKKDAASPIELGPDGKIPEVWLADPFEYMKYASSGLLPHVNDTDGEEPKGGARKRRNTRRRRR